MHVSRNISVPPGTEFDSEKICEQEREREKTER